MKIAIFGGRFDPPHIGHLKIASEILKLKKADEVWFVPDNFHQWNPIVASIKNRLEMLELLIKNKDNMKVNDIASKLGGTTETIKVIRELRKMYQHDYFFICGSDQLINFSKWTHWEELQKELKFLIILRTGFPIRQLADLPENYEILDDMNYQPLNNSSTEIRNRIKKGLSIMDLVTEEVKEYVVKQELYK